MDFSGNPAGIPQLAFTHGGRFHADDVFSAALLKILRPDIRIYRGFQVPKNFSGIVFDIGDGPFDHHQKGSPRRANGAAYASFGLLWQAYGHHFLSEKEAARFDEKFIQPLDIDDNKGTGNTLAGLIGAFNPTWDSDDDPDQAFEEALDVAYKMLYHKLNSLAAVERGTKVVEQALEKMRDGIVELDIYVPWKPVLVESPAEFVIFPTLRGGYSLQCVPKDYNGKTGHKVPLPHSWYARPAEELQEITGVPDVSFCHASGFMCAVSSLEGARKLALLAQTDYQKRCAAAEARREAAAKAETEKQQESPKAPAQMQEETENGGQVPAAEN